MKVSMKKTLSVLISAILLFSFSIVSNATGGDYNGDELDPRNGDTIGHVHTYTWVITKPATETENGIKEEICSICGHKSGNNEVIPKLFGEYVKGDINGDRSVNNKDLTKLFQYLSNWDVEVNELALDVNGDTFVNNKDFTRLFQYLSGWNVSIF